MKGSRYASLRDALRDDVGRAIAMGAGAAIAFGPIEYGLTIWQYAGPIGFVGWLRLAAMVATLGMFLWLFLTVVFAGAAVVARAIALRVDGHGRGRGLFAVAPLDDGVRPGVPKAWAVIATLGAVMASVLLIARYALGHFKDPGLMPFWIASRSLVPIALGYPLYRMLAASTHAGAQALAFVGAFNPLGRWRAAGVAVAGLIGGAIAAVWLLLPDAHGYVTPRAYIALLMIFLGAGWGAWFHGLRRPRVLDVRRARFAFGGAAVVVTMTLCWWGADVATRYVAITASPALAKLIDGVRVLNDFDRDGYGSLLGDNDCAPFNSAINPSAEDKPDDGIDQDCDGEDFSLKSVPAPIGPSLPVPDKFKKDWNVLLITVDTLRYDHTGFGGYKEAPKHRDNTPRLDELVSKSVSFTFTNAPSAGTMASIPAIITSKFFHSGIALDEHVAPGMPPKLMPENTLLSEIMKRKGYYTGVIASHEYWNDWGMDQGVDEYDNSIGRTSDPYRVAADKSTDHALAWISRQQAKKWFLWLHYIDPHGRYVAHPDVVDYGSSEPDLYDAEVKWTDQQIGRLLDELKRLPSHQNTIIVLTSDHGDSMAEHNVPLGTHGTALYWELQRVPMIFYIPDNAPRLIGGATTNLDIVPTVAELCGIDVKDLSFEGRSLVGSLFYGKEDHSRIVFAETNAPTRQRAAISEKWKLIDYISNNLFELYDLTADPGEKHNLAISDPKPPAFMEMKRALAAWMDRVLNAPDPKFNQAYRQVADVKTQEKAPVATVGQAIDTGRIEILGIGAVQPVVAGTKIDFHVYLRANQAPVASYKFLLTAWPVVPGAPATDTTTPGLIRSPMRPTADGMYPSDKWAVGESIREHFALDIPADWKGAVRLGLVAQENSGQKAAASGSAPANDAFTIVLGDLPIVAKPTP